MKGFSAIKLYFNKTQIVVLVLFTLLLFYPRELKIGEVVLVNDFIKTRVISLGILFLILRALVHDYYSPRLTTIFLVMLILTPTLSFGHLLIATLILFLVLRLFNKI